MGGMAMLTIETSSRFMNAASSMTTSAAHRRGSAGSFAAAPAAACGGRISASELIGSPPWRTTLREVIISDNYCLVFLDTWKSSDVGRGGGSDDGAWARGGGGARRGGRAGGRRASGVG